jgi:hypothetical protein
MDPTYKRRWIKALRSGQYPQTTGRLHIKTNTIVKPAARTEVYDTRPAGYCCLGVLYQVVEGYPPECGDRLAPSMLEKVKLNTTIQSRLVSMNDAERKSFDQIADWIEDYL